MGLPDDSRAGLRCSHADRDAAAERLREAAGDGRLDLDELEARLERAFSAKTYGELDALLADLPAGAGTAVAPVHSDVMRISAPVSDRKQEGRWVVPPRIVAESGLGAVKIDFTDAVCSHAVVHVSVTARAGNVVLVVPEGWSARTDDVSSGAGSVRNKVPGTGGTPLLHVSGQAILGSVVVRHPRRTRFLPR